MRKITILFTLAIAALSLNCGGGAATNNTANKPANANANANKPANTPATTPANTATNTSDKKETASNDELDFTLVNKTGHPIKEVLVGPTATKEWTPDMEILKGRSFGDGASLDIKFSPKLKAAQWDIKVEWADGSGSEEWIDLDLTTIQKVTLKYDEKTDKTTAEIE